MSVSIPKVIADLDLSLASSVVAGNTTATLSSATDSDGIALPSGKYVFTVDLGQTNKEYILCDLVGTALTGIQNLSRQGVATTGFGNYHRSGASMAITDWAILGRIYANLTAVTGFDSGANLFYDGAPTGLTGNMLATVNYVLSVVNGGTVTFDQQVAANQTAGENLTSGRPVYLKESDGKWYQLLANATSYQARRRGIALATVSTNASLTIALSGPVSGLSGLVAGTEYFASNAGILATSAGTFEVFMGWALSTTVLLLDPYGRDIPLGEQKDALAGTLGTPSTLNKYLTKYNTYSDVDQSQTTQDTTSAIGEANATTKRNKLAQSFIPVYPGIRGVALYKAANTGTYTGDLTVALQADSAGAPSGSNLASITIPNATYLLLPVGEFLAEFTSEYISLTPGSTYWMVVSSSTADNSNHPNLNYNSVGGYGNGIFRFNNTTDGWTSVVGADLYFKTLDVLFSQVGIADPTGGLIPVPVLPAGVLDVNTTGTTLASSTTETTVYTKQFSIATWRLNSGIYLKGFVVLNASASGQSVAIKVKLNGTTVATLTGTALAVFDTVKAIYEVYIVNNASTSSQKYIASLLGVKSVGNAAGASTNAVSPVSDFASGTASIDTTVPVVLTVTMTNSNNSASTGFTQNAVVLSKIGL